MDMSTPRKALIGLFLLGGLVLFGTGLFLIGDRRLLFDPRFELYTAFGKVTGLQVGTRVRVAGLDAGEVLEIALPARPSEPFRIRMRLREDLRPLVRVDSVSALQTDGIVGNAFVQIGRGTDQARMVEPGETIAGRDPVEFADLIDEGRETFRAVALQIRELTDESGEAIDAIGDVARSAQTVIDDVGGEVRVITSASAQVAQDARKVIAETEGLLSDARAGKGTIGKFLTDDSMYERFVSIAAETEETVKGMRAAADGARSLVDGFGAREGAAQQIVQTLRETLADTREVMSDLSEGTEALKRNFLFRGFFEQRGFFDLDAISVDAYATGALEGKDRTALRVWIDAAGLFASDVEGVERLTDAGRRRLDSAMADLVRYPRDTPLIVEGYADGSEGRPTYLVSSDRAQAVREYLLSRYRRRVTLTGAMPMSSYAPGSPAGNDRWSGVALTLFVRHDALMAGR
jgi:phospholipid/cholesterol/gamma-HCH transport system substrate-binding protein